MVTKVIVLASMALCNTELLSALAEEGIEVVHHSRELHYQQCSLDTRLLHDYEYQVLPETRKTGTLLSPEETERFGNDFLEVPRYLASRSHDFLRPIYQDGG